MNKVYFKIRRESGLVEELQQPKLNTMTRELYKELVEVYCKKTKDYLLEIRLVKPKVKLNKDWLRYNNAMNEGYEGYNPHTKWLNDGEEEIIFR